MKNRDDASPLTVAWACWEDARYILGGLVSSMDVKKVVARAIRQYDLPESFTEDTLLAAVGAVRGRPLKLKQMPAGFGVKEGLTALWLPTNEIDYVLYGAGESDLHRRQFVLHEIAHMILGHDVEEGAVSFSHLFPDIPESVMRRALARHDMNNEFELAAEHLADRLAAGLRAGVDSTKFSEVFG